MTNLNWLSQTLSQTLSLVVSDVVSNLLTVFTAFTVYADQCHVDRRPNYLCILLVIHGELL